MLSPSIWVPRQLRQLTAPSRSAAGVAEDLAQETFIKVLNHIDKYRPEFKLSSWLFKIANNVAIDHMRKRHVETISMDGSPHARSTAETEATSFDVEARGETAIVALLDGRGMQGGTNAG